MKPVRHFSVHSDYKHLVAINILIILLELCLFVYLRAWFSIIPWMICLVAGHFIGLSIERKKLITRGGYDILITSYLLISLMGLLICLDNQNNFGTFLGCGGDDTRFFGKILMLIKGTPEEETGFYEYVLATFGWGMNLLKLGDLQLTDLLPLNWLLAAFCAMVCYQLAFELMCKRCPFFIILTSLLFNFTFTDSITRLYRDVLMLFFSLLFLLFLINDKRIKMLVSLVPLMLIRMANGFLLLLFVGLLILKKRVKRVMVFYALTGVLGGFFVAVINYSNINLLNYTSSYVNFARYNRVFKNYSTKEMLELRNKSIAGSVPESSLKNVAYIEGGIKGKIVKIIYALFYPLTFNSPSTELQVSATISNSGYVKGFYLYLILQWLFILSWIAVLPYLFLGLYKAMFGSNLQVTIFVFYIIVTLLVSLISGQQRHGCILVVLNPILANIGFHYSRSNRQMIFNHKLLTVAVIIGITGWNLAK